MMMSCVEETHSLTMNTGAAMPILGLGTWRSPPEVVTQVVKDAIDIGYRHLDCAHIYGNEAQVGAGIVAMIKEGVIKREDLFVTSKLWNTFHEPELVRKACETTLQNLQLDYLDNYLIHWPMGYKSGGDLYPRGDKAELLFSDVDFVDTWHAMEELVDAGLCRAIGVSNFSINQLERLMASSRIQPANLQIECHPYLNQTDIIKYAHMKEIVVTAYSPLGSGHTPYPKPGEYPLLEHPLIIQIANRNCMSPAQLLIRYQIQRGNAVIPRSISYDHLLQNLKAANCDLPEADVKLIDQLNCNGRFLKMTDAANHVYYPFKDELKTDLETAPAQN